MPLMIALRHPSLTEEEYRLILTESKKACSKLLSVSDRQLKVGDFYSAYIPSDDIGDASVIFFLPLHADPERTAESDKIARELRTVLGLKTGFTVKFCNLHGIVGWSFDAPPIL